MLCDNCHKNEATVYYTETINGYHTEQHLCQECASKLGAASFGMYSPFKDQEFSLGNLLSTVLGYHNVYAGANHYGNEDLSCDKCGMTYKEFLKKGKFGCSNCISSFSSEIDSSLKRIHGSNVHVGKKPINYISSIDQLLSHTGSFKDKKDSGLSNDNENIDILISKLRDRLNKAVEMEEYEEAARLRDQIRELKKTKDQEENINKEQEI
ncbi:MAG: hypothetical protein GX323_05260 [Clostridiales bacterium]|nr:hypothetical protein [Clostridiales bacterium]